MARWEDEALDFWKKVYPKTCEQQNLQGRSTYYLGEKIVDKYLD